MNREELQKQFMDILAAGKIQPTTIIFGDNVQNKIEKVEAGGVVNIAGGKMNEPQQDDPDSSSSAPDVSSHKKLFPCITKAAFDAGKAESVDDGLRSASVSAPKLIKALNLNEALGYVDTKNMNSKDLYDLLDDCYELKFGPRCFRNYRCK